MARSTVIIRSIPYLWYFISRIYSVVKRSKNNPKNLKKYIILEMNILKSTGRLCICIRIRRGLKHSSETVRIKNIKKNISGSPVL
jgi:hypothetical protein